MSGRSPSGPGWSAEPEPISVVSAETASVPNAERTANKLGRKEKDALLGKKVSGGTKPSLLMRGLLELVPRNQPRANSQPRFDYVLTEMGRAVASAIEARSDATGTGAAEGESAIGAAETPTTPLAKAQGHD